MSLANFSRIAQQISLAFDVEIDKDIVRHVLANHYRPESWLTFLGHSKDSLWSVDLFRCESATLRTREYLDRVLFWSPNDLAHKLSGFQAYYNENRTHASLPGKPPALGAGERTTKIASLSDYLWQPHCRGLFHTPLAA